MPENKTKKTNGPYIGAIDEGTSSARFLVRLIKNKISTIYILAEREFDDKNRHFMNKL